MLHRTSHVRLGCTVLPLLQVLASSPASVPSLLLGLLGLLPAAAMLLAVCASMLACTSGMRLQRYWKMRGISPAYTTATTAAANTDSTSRCTLLMSRRTYSTGSERVSAAVQTGFHCGLCVQS
jgi:hypothetical protein